MMGDETKEKKSLSGYFTKKVIVTLSVIATVLSIVGGIWKFDGHYATNQKVDGIALAAKNNVDDLEIQIASALQNQQYKSDVRYFQFMYDKIRDDIYELKKKIERTPDNELLKQDYQDLIDRRNEIKRKIDEAMQKIQVN